MRRTWMRRGQRIGFAAIRLEHLERATQPRHRAHAAIRQAGAQHAIGVHQQADAVLDRHRVFGQSRGDVGVQPEPVERAGAHAAAATGVDDHQDLEVLRLAVFARHQRAAARRGLPVDARQRVAAHVIAQLQQLDARAGQAPRRFAGGFAGDRPRAARQAVGRDGERRVLRQVARPPREREPAEQPRRDRAETAGAEPQRQQIRPDRAAPLRAAARRAAPRWSGAAPPAARARTAA